MRYCFTCDEILWSDDSVHKSHKVIDVKLKLTGISG